jgi:lipopolysaccharide transport system ATP-binding protein
MFEPAIKIKNLSKLYQLGLFHNRPDSLREQLMGFVKRVGVNTLRWRKGIQDNIESDGKNQKCQSIWALEDVSLEIPYGEVFGVIGANGAGKSTLLKILARITKPTRGQVVINGRIGSLLEVGTGFHPEMTGRENIFLNGSILGMKRKEISSKFDQIVSFAEVEKFIDTPVKRYSSGMYVRLAFSVAAHLDPEILLVDEVLAVGDLAFQAKCLGRIQEVTVKGRTVLFVSHHMAPIQALCQRAVWIDRGRIVQCGPAGEVVQAYEKDQIQSVQQKTAVNLRHEVAVSEKGLYCNRIKMANSSGEETCIFRYDDRLTLDVDITNNSDFSNYSIEFRIYKSRREFAAVGSSGYLHGLFFSAKVRRIRINIGPLKLTNGEYSISLRLIDGNTLLDNWEHACVFHIIDCHPFPMPREIKAPVCVIDHSYGFE